MRNGRFAQWSAVVQALAQAERKGTKLYHVLFQQLVYLLQEAFSLPLEYRFGLRLPGLYSDDLWKDLQTFAELHFVAIQPDPGSGTDILCVGPQIDWILTRGDPQLNQRVAEAVSRLHPNSIGRLDVLALTVYVDSLSQEGGVHDRNRLVQRVKELKPSLKDADVWTAIAELNELVGIPVSP